MRRVDCDTSRSFLWRFIDGCVVHEFAASRRSEEFGDGSGQRRLAVIDVPALCQALLLVKADQRTRWYCERGQQSRLKAGESSSPDVHVRLRASKLA